jgi:hypothetical protein
MTKGSIWLPKQNAVRARISEVDGPVEVGDFWHPPGKLRESKDVG